MIAPRRRGGVVLFAVLFEEKIRSNVLVNQPQITNQKQR